MNETLQEILPVIIERKEECQRLMNVTPTLEGLYCQMRFDGWSCWPHTPAGQTASQLCPEFIPGFDAKYTAYHKCELNGEWFKNPESNRTWANYTTCVNLDELGFHHSINTIYIIGYSMSLIALLTSLMILSYFKSLRCARITIHMNLFASFAANNFLWILWYTSVLGDVDVLNENTIWCRILHVILYYFLISNYSWMLCEGVYLHTVLVSAFISESKLLKCMLALGWGIPFITIDIYASLRQFAGDTDENVECWMNETKYNIILIIPVASAIISNVLFLINIVRVLLIKLRRGPASEASGASRTSMQALRATLFLAPLLGVNYLLTPFRPLEGHPLFKFYEYLSAITASLQGLCVAILFCFCNGEVIAQVKRKYRAVTFRPRANSCTVTTVSFVRSSYPANGEEKV